MFEFMFYHLIKFGLGWNWKSWSRSNVFFPKMAFYEENHVGHDKCSHDFLWLAYILLGDKNDFFSCHKDTVQETCNW